MKKITLEKIRKNPYLYSLLREESNHYKYLLRDEFYIKQLEVLAKEKYKLRPIDKIEKLKDQINLIETIINVMK